MPIDHKISLKNLIQKDVGILQLHKRVSIFLLAIMKID